MNYRQQLLNSLLIAPASRATLAQQLGVTRAYMTRLSSELIAQGIIVEEGAQEGDFGRPQMLLALAQGRYYSISVMVRGYRLEAYLCDYARPTVTLAQCDHDFISAQSTAAVLHQLEQVIVQLTAAAQVSRQQLRHVGIALQGGIEQFSGVVRRCPLFQETQIAFKTQLGEQIGIDVAVMNIAWCSSVMIQRALPQLNSWLALLPGLGSLGYGLFLNGSVVLGDNGYYPEIVHLPFAGGMENAFQPQQEQNALEALCFAICCTAPVHNLRHVVLAGEFFDSAPDTLIPELRQRLAQHPLEQINTLDITWLRLGHNQSLQGLLTLSAEAVSACLI